MSVDTLRSITEAYLAEADEVQKKSGPFAGIMGFGGGLAHDGCHERYYDAMAEALKDESLDPYETVKFLFGADEEYSAPQTVKCMLTAVQGLALPLIPKLSAEQREEFRAAYDAKVPKRTRLPVQRELYKALSEK